MGHHQSDDVALWNGFSAQFERNGERWTFRRGCRAPPVEVTKEEMDRATAIQQNGTLALFAILLSALVFGLMELGTSYGPSDPKADEFDRLLTVAAAILFWIIGFFLVSYFATRRFNGRAPLGTPRTRLDVRRMWAREKSGFDLCMPLLLGLYWAWIGWPLTGPSDWFWLSIVGFWIGSTSFDLFLKRQASRS